MTANTRQTSNSAPSTQSSSPSSTASSGANKSSIRMAAHGPLTALHALAKSYRDMMDLLKETRKSSINLLQKFTEENYKQAMNAAKDSKKALYMQAGASVVGGALSIGGAAANGLSGGAEKQKLADAASKKDFLEGIKRDLSGGDLNLSTTNGGGVATAQTEPATDGTSRAMALIKDNNFGELRRCNQTVAFGQPDHITTDEMRDAAKLLSVGAQPDQEHDLHGLPVSRGQLMENVSNRILVQSNAMNVASTDLGRLDARNKSLVDLAQGVQQGGFSIGQGQANEKARQEEAEVGRLSQSQKMADQAQSEFAESNKQLARDLASISEQVGRIIPMRG